MNYTEKTLKNGLRIITAPMPNSLTTTVLVLTQAGSKYESKEINGISHFLEHVCFKGTKKRPSAKIITTELDNLGASYNAFTGEEYTGYYAVAEPQHFESILDIVSDIFLNSTFPPPEIDKERGVIMGEIDMYLDNPRHVVNDLFTDLLYGDQPAGRTILGPKKNIKKLKRKDFINYNRKHYVASGTVVVVAGKFNKKTVNKTIEKYLKGIRDGAKSGKKKVKENQKNASVLLKEKKTNQSHLILGFRSFNMHDKRFFAANVLAGILAGGMSSRLFQKIRDDMGAGYYIGASNNFFSDHGVFEIYGGIDNKKVDKVIVEILKEVKNLKDELVSKEELSKVKNIIAGSMVSRLGSSSSIAEYYGLKAISNKKMMTAKEEIKEIRKVTSADVRNVARDIFKEKNLNLAILGPFNDKKRFLNLLKT